MKKSNKKSPRAYTEQEAREMFIRHCFSLAEYWSKQKRNNPTELDRMEGLIHSILCIFDGSTMVFPAMDIVLRPHESDKDYCVKKGENWFKNGMVINNTMLHEIMFRINREKSE